MKGELLIVHLLFYCILIFYMLEKDN